MALDTNFRDGLADGEAGRWPRQRDAEYMRGYTRGRERERSKHRTFSDAAVISDGMKRASGAHCTVGGANLNRSIGNVEGI